MATILLVDDDDSLRTMLRMALGRLGHTVIEARDGNEAIRVCWQSPPDLILTDLIMPGKEGLETIQEIKTAFPNLPILAMSGGGRSSVYLSLASHLGAMRVLAKPFSDQELIDAVEAAMKRDL